jgi:hypothetical protein
MQMARAHRRAYGLRCGPAILLKRRCAVAPFPTSRSVAVCVGVAVSSESQRRRGCRTHALSLNLGSALVTASAVAYRTPHRRGGLRTRV